MGSIKDKQNDEYGRQHASGIHCTGRILLNMWRLLQSEVKLNIYTFEACVAALMQKRTPHMPAWLLTQCFKGGLSTSPPPPPPHLLPIPAHLNVGTRGLLFLSFSSIGGWHVGGLTCKDAARQGHLPSGCSCSADSGWRGMGCGYGANASA